MWKYDSVLHFSSSFMLGFYLFQEFGCSNFIWPLQTYFLYEDCLPRANLATATWISSILELARHLQESRYNLSIYIFQKLLLKVQKSTFAITWFNSLWIRNSHFFLNSASKKSSSTSNTPE